MMTGFWSGKFSFVRSLFSFLLAVSLGVLSLQILFSGTVWTAEKPINRPFFQDFINSYSEDVEGMREDMYQSYLEQLKGYSEGFDGDSFASFREYVKNDEPESFEGMERYYRNGVLLSYLAFLRENTRVELPSIESVESAYWLSRYLIAHGSIGGFLEDAGEGCRERGINVSRCNRLILSQMKEFTEPYGKSELSLGRTRSFDMDTGVVPADFVSYLVFNNSGAFKQRYGNFEMEEVLRYEEYTYTLDRVIERARGLNEGAIMVSNIRIQSKTDDFESDFLKILEKEVESR